ncbi:MAG: hypothetical protein JWQ65_1878 [Devosia sp.]|nr:hypothetical protein [Devosia sp.]
MPALLPWQQSRHGSKAEWSARSGSAAHQWRLGFEHAPGEASPDQQRRQQPLQCKPIDPCSPVAASSAMTLLVVPPISRLAPMKSICRGLAGASPLNSTTIAAMTMRLRGTLTQKSALQCTYCDSALHQTRSHQHGEVCGQCGQRRAHQEQPHADQQRRLAAAQIGDGAKNRGRSRRGQQVCCGDQASISPPPSAPEISPWPARRWSPPGPP